MKEPMKEQIKNARNWLGCFLNSSLAYSQDNRNLFIKFGFAMISFFLLSDTVCEGDRQEPQGGTNISGWSLFFGVPVLAIAGGVIGYYAIYWSSCDLETLLAIEVDLVAQIEELNLRINKPFPGGTRSSVSHLFNSWWSWTPAKETWPYQGYKADVQYKLFLDLKLATLQEIIAWKKPSM